MKPTNALHFFGGRWFWRFNFNCFLNNRHNNIRFINYWWWWWCWWLIFHHFFQAGQTHILHFSGCHAKQWNNTKNLMREKHHSEQQLIILFKKCLLFIITGTTCVVVHKICPFGVCKINRLGEANAVIMATMICAICSNDKLPWSLNNLTNKSMNKTKVYTHLQQSSLLISVCARKLLMK